MPKCDFNKAALQLYSNRTSAWVFSKRFLKFPSFTLGKCLLRFGYNLICYYKNTCFMAMPVIRIAIVEKISQLD